MEPQISDLLIGYFREPILAAYIIPQYIAGNYDRGYGGGQGGKRLGDETSVSEQKGVMQWTGIEFGARCFLGFPP